MKKLTTEQWINKAKEIHGDKYNYSITMYSTAKTKLKIICSKHGEQEMLPHHHIKGYGCGKCGKEQINISNGKQLSQREFINRAKILNSNLSFNKTTYKNKRSNLIITCDIHGDYTTKAEMILKGSGCPKCKSSKGESYIEKWLISKDIKYIKEKAFKNLIFKKHLRFDFYLPEHKMCIEYDGEQHFKAITYWGGLEKYEELKQKDDIKNRFCAKNNLSLLRISYKENINKKLGENIIIKREKYAISRSKTN